MVTRHHPRMVQAAPDHGRATETATAAFVGACREEGTMKTLMIVWGLTCSGDAVTTHHILSTGGREVWLPTQNPSVAAVVAGGTCAVGIPAIYNLSKTHPKAARVIGWTLVGVRGSIVASNLNQIRQHP